MAHEGHLLLILHEVPEPGVPERQGVVFWRAPSGKWSTNVRGNGLTELRALVTRYIDRVDALESAFAAANSVERLFPVLRAATPIERSCRLMHGVLQAAREAQRKDRDIINIRDLAGEVVRAAELLNTEARTALEFDIAESAEAQAKANRALAEAGQRLNLLAAVFLPLTALASAFGMNLPSGLENVASPMLFWFVLIVGITVGMLVRGGLNRRNPGSAS